MKTPMFAAPAVATIAGGSGSWLLVASPVGMTNVHASFPLTPLAMLTITSGPVDGNTKFTHESRAGAPVATV